LILALNTLRIGTLGRLAASPSLFQAFHLWVWPAALSLAVAGYVFAWMRHADRQRETSPAPPAPATATEIAEGRGFRPTRRFALLAAAFLLIFTATAPIYLESAGVLSLAAFIARAAAAALRFLGVEAQASANQLWTPRGSFLVTQECIATPLIPIYLAAVIALGGSWRCRLPALLAAVPLFVGLGIARLLVVALPATLAASPVSLIHAFFQALLAAVVVGLAARWGHPDGGAARRALLGLFLGAAFLVFLGAPYSRVVLSATRVLGGTAGTAAPDPQGAVALLPAFQVGLYLALWAAAGASGGWRRFAAGLALLGLSQPATLAIIPLFAGRIGPSLQVQGVRAWALAAPVLVVVVMHLSRASGGIAQPESPRGDAVRG
ncbi:MAG TPA: archaeosortase/exosortase family protein, partial [Candidatus Methanoperedens sp.]|nr:archaeosortase/exosortase family protein [Candidatus Methanoperedens sp.]